MTEAPASPVAPTDSAEPGAVTSGAADSGAADSAAVTAEGSENVTVHLETELKFAPPADAELPDLTGIAELSGPVEHELAAVYFDSPDYRLARATTTLRRRTGGPDAGWHLKLPGTDTSGADTDTSGTDTDTPGTSTASEVARARQELHVDLQDGDEHAVPAELLAIVSERIGQVPLIPVAQLCTDRRVFELRATGAGQPAAELCDDTVTAVRFARPGVPAARAVWRELEVELNEGSAPELLGEVAEALERAGIEPSEFPSKLSRALGRAPAWAADRSLSGRSPLVETVLKAMAVHIGVLQHRAADVAVDAPDAVHKARVASRRLRSILKTFAPLFDAVSVQRLRIELKWFATRLGLARDAEVQLARLPELLDELPAEAITPGMPEQLEELLRDHHRRAVRSVQGTLRTKRCAALMRSLQEWLEDPPLNPGWDITARTAKSFGPLLDAAVARVRKAHKRVQRTTGAEQLVHRHEVRKKAKVVRYVCEALAPALGEKAQRAAAAWEAVTEHYGELNDAAVAREWILGLARRAEEAGTPSFTYGVLFATQLSHTQGSLEEADALLDEALAIRL